MSLCRIEVTTLVVLIASFVGCNSSSRGPGTASENAPSENKTTEDPPPRPSLQLVNVLEHSFTKGVNGRVWTMKGYGLKRLSVKLILISDGNSHTVKEVDYRWDDACHIEGQLIYLMNEAEVFGAKDARLPSLSASFLDVTPDGSQNKPAASATTSPKLLEGDWILAGSQTLNAVGKPSAPSDIADGILHSTSFKTSSAGSISYETSTADLSTYVEASKKGVAFVLVMLESERF